MPGQVPPLPAGYRLNQASSAPAAAPVPPLPNGYTLDTPGELRNDVGNRVIVPKDGESFADTMQRAAVYGKTVTPGQINAEMATAPKKVAQTLVAAPAIGAAGTAALAGAGEGVSYLGRQAFQSLKNALPDQATVDQVIKVGKMIRDLSLTAAAGKYLYHAIYGEEQ